MKLPAWSWASHSQPSLPHRAAVSAKGREEPHSLEKGGYKSVENKFKITWSCNKSVTPTMPPSKVYVLIDTVFWYCFSWSVGHIQRNQRKVHAFLKAQLVRSERVSEVFFFPDLGWYFNMAWHRTGKKAPQWFHDCVLHVVTHLEDATSLEDNEQLSQMNGLTPNPDPLAPFSNSAYNVKRGDLILYLCGIQQHLRLCRCEEQNKINEVSVGVDRWIRKEVHSQYFFKSAKIRKEARLWRQGQEEGHCKP